MQRLLKRRKVQECLQDTEKEMGDSGMSLNDLESLLNEEGIDTKIEALPSRRIAANNTTRFVLINNVKQALADAKKKKEAEASTSKTSQVIDKPDSKGNSKKDELEEDLEKAIKLSLECENEVDISVSTSKTDDSWTTYDTGHSSNSEEEDGCEPPDMSSAKAYIMQYSDFTENAINDIVTESNKNNKNRRRKPKINEILEEINKEKTVVLSSSDEDVCIQNDKNFEDKHAEMRNYVVELKTPTDVENKERMDTTQASVACLGTKMENVISLDSSLDESPSQSTSFAKEHSPQHKDKENSDSSDSDFEDVPEIEDNNSKTVVELTLNVNDAPEDDIFADVFNTKKPLESKIQKDNRPVSPKLNDVEFVDEHDEELQRAIKMSLEVGVESDENVESELTDDIEPIVSKFKDKVLGSLKELNKNAIQSKQASKIIPIKNKNEIDQNGNSDNQTIEPISTEKLNTMVEEIQNEEQDLMQEKGRLDRVGRNITEQMTKEAQELLQMFGIPYIVAPMEAEAQCAFLESVKLTDGTITDDSDIWLFGGKTVYKNFFNQKKHVLQFLSERIEKSFSKYLLIVC